MWLLKLINIKDFRYVLLIVIIGYGVFMYQQNKLLKAENKRVSENYKTALHADSLEVAIYKVTKDQEVLELLSKNNELSSLVKQSKIKTKRIQNLYYQQLEYVDSLKRKVDVSSLVTKIRKDIPALVKWEDKNECLTVKGNVSYQEDSLSVNVTERIFSNNTVLIKHRGRRKPVKWLFGLRLGPRAIKFTPETKCGSNKVTIIEKE